jgi:WD40-like Beta Propeller Repeat
VTLLGLCILTSPVMAAFPGRNGVLAVQPLKGRGIVLVGIDGKHPRTICTQTAVCGTPRDPKFSPDGRELVFDAPAVRLIATDGSCVNCQFGKASSPAFLPGGALVTFLSGGNLLEDGIDGLWRQTVLGAARRTDYSSAVWSAGGQLAVVRNGHVWIGRPGRLRSIGAGRSPSWSPNGSRLAIARGGWIVIARPSNGISRRLVRGSAPAFSPDGRWVAFIGAKHRLAVISASGGHERLVGHITGVSVDWQPIRRAGVAGCVAPPGSQVIASSPQAVITTAVAPSASSGSLPNTAVMGCLRASGLARLLEKFTFNSIDWANQVTLGATSGNYAAVVNRNFDEHYGGQTETTAGFDLRTGHATRFGGESTACPYCTIDDIALGANGVSAVHVNSGPLGAGTDPIVVSCASTSVCLTSDQFGDLTSSANPTVGPWTPSRLPWLYDIACPSSAMCVGTSANGPIYTSTNPAGGASSWNATQIPGAPNFVQVSCPTTSFCVALQAGYYAFSTDPTGGAASWSRQPLADDNFDGISCPSSSECLVTDQLGNVFSTTDPTGGPGAWTARHVVPDEHGLGDISCPSTSLCVSNVLTAGTAPQMMAASTDPTSGPWTLSTVGPYVSAVDCPAVSLCVAVGGDGTIDTSTDPAAGSWTATTLGGPELLTSISCPTTTFCIAGGGGNGDAYISTNPTGGAGAWTRVLADPIDCSLTPTACGTEEIIASDATGVHTADSVTEFEAQTGSQLTDLALSGTHLTWEHSGTPMSAELSP